MKMRISIVFCCLLSSLLAAEYLALAQVASGVSVSLPIGTVTADGWTLCYSDSFATSGVSLTTIMSVNCNKDLILIGCRASSSATTLTTAAWGTKSTILSCASGSQYDPVCVHNGENEELSNHTFCHPKLTV